MKIIDFRFRPHTEAILNGIKNSTMSVSYTHLTLPTIA